MLDQTVFTVGGVVQAAGGAYLTRPADQELLALCRQQVYAYILTPRQLGKSSLVVNTAERLVAEEITPVIVDLTECGVLASAEEWFFGVTTLIASRLGLEEELTPWWSGKQALGLTQRFVAFFQEFVISRTDRPIVIFVDEADSTLSLDFTDDFFVAIRLLHAARAQFAELRRLSFVLIGVASPNDLIGDGRRASFNIGQRVLLDDFTREEIAPLAAGLPATADEAAPLLDWVMDWTGGHPYLTQRLCAGIAGAPLRITSRPPVDELARSLFLGHVGQTDSNLQFVKDMLLKQSSSVTEVLSVYRDVYRNRRGVRDDASSEPMLHLKLSGVVTSRDNLLSVRNRIYREVFDQKWIRQNWPQDWWRVIPFQVRVALLAILILAVMLSVTVIFAVRQQRLAEEAALRAQEQTVLAEGEALRTAQQTEIAESEARRAEQQSQLAARRLLTAQSQILISDDRPRLGALLSIESVARELAAGGTEVASSVNLLRQALGLLKATILYGHDGQVWDVAFTPDSRWLVTSGTDNKVLIWDPASPTRREALHRLEGHAGRVWDVAISPDGHWLATASADRTVRLWDLTQADPGESGRTLAGHTNAVLSLAFGPDSRQLASGGADRTVLLWSLDDEGPTGEPRQLAELSDRVWSLAISGDGRWLAANARVDKVRLWDLARIADDPLGRDLVGHSDRIWAIGFSPDSRWLVSAALDRSARRWDLLAEDANAAPEVLRGHSDGIVTLAFSPDGRWLATGGLDRTARVWDMDSGEPDAAFVLRGHDELVFRVRFSGDSRRLVTSSSDHTVRLWDLDARDPVDSVVTLLGHDDAVPGVAYSPDGHWLASAGWDGTAQLWDLAAPLADASAVRLAGFRRPVVRVRFGEDGGRLFTAEQGGGLIWDVPADGSAPRQSSRLSAVGASRDLSWTIARDDEGGLGLLSLAVADFESTWISMAPADIWTNTVAISNDGRWAVTGMRPGQPAGVPEGSDASPAPWRLWDLEGLRAKDGSGVQFVGRTAISIDEAAAGRASHTLGSSDAGILMALFSDDGRWLLVEWTDFTGGLWDLSGGLPERPWLQLERHTQQWIAAFSADGSRLATVGDDQLLEVWNLTDPDPVATTRSVVNRPLSSRRPYDLAFSPDGRWLVTAISEFAAVIRRVDEWEGLERGIVLPGHSGAVFTVAFSPDSRWLATGSLDQTIRIWDLAAPDPAAHPFVLSGHEDWVLSVDFSPDGRWLLSGARNASALLWPLDLEALIVKGCEAIGRSLTRDEWLLYLGEAPYEPSCQGPDLSAGAP